MKILCMHTNTGSRFYRVIPQLKWMQEHGHQIALAKRDDPDLAGMLEWCDVLLLQMVFSPEYVKLAKSKGKKVIFECDDLIHKTHELHYAYKETDTFYKRMRWLWRLWRVLRQCDGLIVSNENLKKAYGWMCKRTFVFGNYLSLEHWLKEPQKNTTDRIRILWGGSTSHTGDLYWVKPILGKILEKYPQVQFIYIGYGGVPTDDLYARFIYGDDVFEGLPQERRESLLPAPPNIWPYVLASLGADIAIAPLEKREFNRYKTQCKYLEYAVNGIPGVYSKWFYTDVNDKLKPRGMRAQHYPTGLLADTPDEWIAALSMLIEDATLRKQIGGNAREEAIEKYNFADRGNEWQGFVESIAHEPAHFTHSSTPQIGS